MAEPIDPGTKLTAGSAAIADKANKATTVSLDEKQLTARPIMSSLTGPPGTYRVRFAATDLISAAMRSMSSWPIPAVGSSSSSISGSSAIVVASSSARLRP